MATYSESEKARILSYPIASVLAHLGKRTDHRGEMFYSPFREESEPSFHVKRSENLWMDFGSGEGGNVLTLVSRLEGIPLQEAWDYVAKLDNNIFIDNSPARISRAPQSTKIIIREVRPLTNSHLIAYGTGRGIHRHLLERYCSEVDFHIEGYSTSIQTAIGFPAGKHWVLRLPSEGRFSKRCTGSGCSLLGPSGKSVIAPSSDRVEVFEGFFDFLSWLELKNRTKPFSDICVLNSVNNLQKGIDFITEHKGISCWLDNDNAGKKAFDEIHLRAPKAHSHTEELSQAGVKDVNELLLHSKQAIVINNSITKPYSFTIKK